MEEQILTEEQIQTVKEAGYFVKKGVRFIPPDKWGDDGLFNAWSIFDIWHEGSESEQEAWQRCWWMYQTSLSPDEEARLKEKACSYMYVADEGYVICNLHRNPLHRPLPTVRLAYDQFLLRFPPSEQR